MTDVFLDGRYIATTKNPSKLVKAIKEKRRKGKISEEVNVSFIEHSDIVKILTDGGRLRRPLIAVENGQSKLTKEHIQKIRENKITWDDLVREGVIEYLDAEEEENAYIALKPEKISKDHTHLELDPLIILGIATSLVPFLEFNRGDRVNYGAKMVGQAIGMYPLNYLQRADTKVNIMIHPQQPLVKTYINDILNYENHPSGQNVNIAVMSYEGYNMEDSIIINKSSIERGLLWTFLFRSHEAEEKRYLGGQEDIIGIPEPGVRGYRGEEYYKHLDEDGIVSRETELSADDVIIGKVSPLRFLGSLDQFITGLENIREASVKVKHGRDGIVDRIFITESSTGAKLVKVILRALKRPEIGDKLASRHGQKGVIGLALPQQEMPFTENGSVPDLIFNPHGIPSRMTIGQLLEILAGKLSALRGEQIDGSGFHSEGEEKYRKELVEHGYRNDGKETLYNGKTGKMFENRIYIGNVFYQKLDHLVSNKIHARSKGPVTLLTKQPTEGKAKKGGLRLGEMEKDCLIAHGASLVLKERFSSDKTTIPICKECGLMATHDRIKNKKYCPVCGGSEVIDVEMAYAFKLLLDELKSMLIYPKIVPKED